MAERELNRSERATIRKLVTELCANYDSQDKICLPLDSPCYMLNKWWTGAYCRYFEKAVLPVDAALESAITGEDTSMLFYQEHLFQQVKQFCNGGKHHSVFGAAVVHPAVYSETVFWIL